MKLNQYLINESASRTTQLQESLHCVGLGITQITRTLLTEESLRDGELFGKSYDSFCDVDVASNDLFEWMKTNPSWVSAVVNNVNVLKKTKWFKSSRYNFYRTNGLMKQVYGTASILLKKMGVKLNPDKWNPGDIWVSVLKSIPQFDNIYDYNAWLSQQLKSGALIGISLKKSGKSPKVVYIDQGAEKPTLEYKGTKKPKSAFNTGITIQTSDPAISQNVRSFRTSTVSSITTELILKGSKARHGKATPSGYIKKHNIPQMPTKTIKNLSQNTEYMNNLVRTLWADNGFTFSDKQFEKDWQERIPKIDSIDGFYRSIINSLEYGAFMNKNKGLANEILTDIYLAGSSEGKFSSDFIKVY